MRQRKSQAPPWHAGDGAGTQAGEYVLRLYVTGATPTAMRAVRNLERICAEHLQGRYTLEVIDVSQRPSLLQDDQIVASPTLIKRLPAPLRRLVGDMSNTDQVLLGLQLRAG